MSSLNDPKDIHYLETASSSVLSHVPRQPMSIPHPRGLICRDSCLQLATRSSFGTSGHVFEDLPAPGEPSAAILGNSRSMASASCGLCTF